MSNVVSLLPVKSTKKHAKQKWQNNVSSTIDKPYMPIRDFSVPKKGGLGRTPQTPPGYAPAQLTTAL